MQRDLPILEDNSISLLPGLSSYPYPFSSVQYLIGIYDAAIEACATRNITRARSSILDLMAALDVPHSRSSARLFMLFELCLERLRCGDFQETREILRIIRDAWLAYSEVEHGPAARA